MRRVTLHRQITINQAPRRAGDVDAQKRVENREENQRNGERLQQSNDEQAELPEIFIAQAEDDRAGLEDDAERDSRGDADQHAHIERQARASARRRRLISSAPPICGGCYSAAVDRRDRFHRLSGDASRGCFSGCRSSRRRVLRVEWNAPTSAGRTLRTAFVLLLVVGVTVLFLAVTWPFLKPLLLGAMLAGLARPLYRWMRRMLGGRSSLAAALTLLLLFLLVAGPISAFVGVVVSQAVNVSEHAIPWVQQHFGPGSSFNVHDWLVQRFPALASYIPAEDTRSWRASAPRRNRSAVFL